MYVSRDLARFPLFQGGFINFGWWEPRARPTLRNRVEASRRLYVKTLEAARLSSASELLEVGCGRGYGCALAARLFHPRTVVGADLFEAQVRRARRLHPNRGLRFVRAAAERLPFQDGSFDRVVSLEAAQHFRSLPLFFREARRVLRPGGRLVVCTFFASRRGALPALRRDIPTISDGLDRVVPISEALKAAATAGFGGLSARSIGARVFPGWDRWIEKCGFERGWSKEWLRAWKLGRLDYVLIQASRPA
jgi:cyclopropane fatty-acyl-phospholipid synthase-like methyltransferase